MSFIEDRTALLWGDPPNIWWPEDRAWCVATDIDLFDTHIDGSGQCIRAVLTNTRLEALPTTIEVRADLGADSFNARHATKRKRRLWPLINP